MKYRGWLIYNGGMKTAKFLEIHDWYIRTARKYQIDLMALSNDELFIGIENGQRLIVSHNTRPDFVLFLDKDIRLAEHLLEWGVPIFNSPETIAICDNKIQMHQQLAKANLPQPLTIFAPMLFSQIKQPNAQFLTYVEKSLSYPLVIKEAYGSFGQQVYLIENRQQLETKAKELIHRPHLFQEYIRSSHGKDVRLHVVGNQVVASMQRVSKADFRANVTNGGEMFTVDPSQEFIDLAIAASKAVGADFSGVDLLYGNHGQPLICEVNSNAHIKNIYQCTGIDVSAFIFEYILAKVQGRS
ncbi:RimK family alpha-L-glutamate ligase [Amphibacillus sp. MSJ-3]|uniref:ATP-grasp domain-containing protein n=1 Tax=Amphibacillus sp. MSJ-3 TaxID=2841505 RepID=UPI001C0F13DC|nr:RimK family alpha-L-glutamate ligase [Amphibacillus sp. MSJ-3]MBU5594047.1 RimK family alpha-L-glutamate ligase [Amphibacillus sp. MSJ-3]